MRLPRIHGRVSPLLPVALAPMGLVAVFILVIVWVSVQTGTLGTAHSNYTFENYRDVLGDPEVYDVLWNTLWFACSTVFFALIIGLPVAWLTERTTIPGKPAIYVIMTLGLLIPGIFVAMGWTFIAHPRIGFLNRWLVDLLALDDGPGEHRHAGGHGVRPGPEPGAAGVHPHDADVPGHEPRCWRKRPGPRA